MKKLVFLISIPMLLLSSFSCGNKKTVVKIDDKTTSGHKHDVDGASALNSEKDTIPENDSLVKMQQGKRRDKFEAPKHGSPEQQKIDSIKAAGAKGKKN